MLGRSQVLMYLIDPTQETPFRDTGPDSVGTQSRRHSSRLSHQELLLIRSIEEIRRRREAASCENDPCQVLVLLTKCDAWQGMLGIEEYRLPWSPGEEGGCGELDLGYLDGVSGKVRSLLRRCLPDVVLCVQPLPGPLTARAGNTEDGGTAGGPRRVLRSHCRRRCGRHRCGLRLPRSRAQGQDCPSPLDRLEVRHHGPFRVSYLVGGDSDFAGRPGRSMGGLDYGR